MQSQYKRELSELREIAKDISFDRLNDEQEQLAKRWSRLMMEGDITEQQFDNLQKEFTKVLHEKYYEEQFKQTKSQPVFNREVEKFKKISAIATFEQLEKIRDYYTSRWLNMLSDGQLHKNQYEQLRIMSNETLENKFKQDLLGRISRKKGGKIKKSYKKKKRTNKRSTKRFKKRVNRKRSNK